MNEKKEDVNKIIDDWYLETYGKPWTQEVADEIIKEEQKKMKILHEQYEKEEREKNFKDYKY